MATLLAPVVQSDQTRPSVEAYLLGQLDFDQCLALQQRLVYESTGRCDGRIDLIICEHPTTLTIGRQGSRWHVPWSAAELNRRKLDIRWVNRGGGCLAHVPGQLAIYPIVPLNWHGFTVGEYLDRLQTGVLATLEELRFHGLTTRGRDGIWGRGGQLVSMGVAVKSWTTYHGAFINVAPYLKPWRSLKTDPKGRTAMSSLVAERPKHAVKITAVRTAIIRHLAEAFGCERYHLYTGHPLLRSLPTERKTTTADVG